MNNSLIKIKKEIAYMPRYLKIWFILNLTVIFTAVTIYPIWWNSKLEELGVYDFQIFIKENKLFIIGGIIFFVVLITTSTILWIIYYFHERKKFPIN